MKLGAIIALVCASVCTASRMVHGPFTKHFRRFLKERGNDYAAAMVDVYGDNGSFGGKRTEQDEVRHDPVVFIHGNSDSALAYEAPLDMGWDKSVGYFLEHGYKYSELYGITYGHRNLSLSFKTQVTCRDLIGIRDFLLTVLDYTGARRLDIIAHSLGVTLARRVAAGGLVKLKEETCDLGYELEDRIDTLVGIAGAHYGMCGCAAYFDAAPACSIEGGFFPGFSCPAVPELWCNSTTISNACGSVTYGTFLSTLNEEQRKPARHVISLWSVEDDIVGNIVFGRPTGLIPGSSVYKAYPTGTHFDMKSTTLKDQLLAVTEHRLS